VIIALNMFLLAQTFGVV